MKNKKIDVITKYFYPVTAGIETNILETYRFLNKSWSVTIHTSCDTHVKKDVLEGQGIVKGLRVKRYHFGKFGFLPSVQKEDLDILALHNFDIFPHFQILLGILRDKLIAKKTYKVILTPHGGFTPEWNIFPVHQRIIKNIYHHTLAVLLVNLSVDAVRAVSDWEKNELIRYGISKKKIHVISNGVEDEAYVDVDKKASEEIKERVKGFGTYIIQVGRIYKIKNYETVIRSLPNIVSNINYVIVGEPEKNDAYKKSLIQLAKDLGVENRVIFAGVIKGVDKYYVMKHAKVMVHMALWESFCNVVNEGMSQGLVCIVADNSALPYIVKNDLNGFLCPTRESRTVAKKINYTVQNYGSPRITAIRERNKRAGLAMSWKNVSLSMDKLYSALTHKYE